MHIWPDGHSISISACKVQGTRVGIPVSRRKFQTHIHLNYIIIKFLSCIKIKNKKKVIVTLFSFSCVVNFFFFQEKN